MAITCTAPLLTSRLLGAQSRVVHGFTTRAGGVSRGPLRSLNLALRPGEAGRHLVDNWERAANAVALDLGARNVALLQQVHGARVLEITEPSGPLAVAGEADAAFTTRTGILLAVRTADCVPVLLAAPGGVAVIHSGWRSTALNVTAKAVEALARATGAAPATFTAAIGPCISSAAYEVGDEVVAGLRGAGLADAVFLRQRGRRRCVDLAAAVAEQLRAAGVTAVDSLGVGTHADPRCFSHRRDGPSTGRQAGLIALVRPFPG